MSRRVASNVGVLSRIVLGTTIAFVLLHDAAPHLTPREDPVVLTSVMAPAGMHSIPEGWQLRQFNQIPYYVVPLHEGGA